MSGRRASIARRAARTFWKARHGSVAVETAGALVVLLVALAGSMEIVRSAYVSDTMDRAARAAARAIALVPDAGANSGNLDTVACSAIRRELALENDFDCAANWTLSVNTGLAPEALLQARNAGKGGASGQMVLVRISWNRQPWELGNLVASLDGQGGQPSSMIAVGVAQREADTGS